MSEDNIFWFWLGVGLIMFVVVITALRGAPQGAAASRAMMSAGVFLILMVGAVVGLAWLIYTLLT